MYLELFLYLEFSWLVVASRNVLWFAIAALRCLEFRWLTSMCWYYQLFMTCRVVSLCLCSLWSVESLLLSRCKVLSYGSLFDCRGCVHCSGLLRFAVVCRSRILSQFMRVCTRRVELLLSTEVVESCSFVWIFLLVQFVILMSKFESSLVVEILFQNRLIGILVC